MVKKLNLYVSRHFYKREIEENRKKINELIDIVNQLTNKDKGE
jgi:hypothetical protein